MACEILSAPLKDLQRNEQETGTGTDLHGERVHVGPERDDGPGAGGGADDGGHDAGLGDGPPVGDADRVELGPHELAGAVLLEAQFGPLVDAPPHATQPRGEPQRARLAAELLRRHRHLCRGEGEVRAEQER